MSKTSRRFTGLQVVARLRSTDEDHSGGESETEQRDVLDWELCSSDEMSDDEETEQFDDTQLIVHLGDLQTADTNVETHSATCFDDVSGSGAAESLSTQETAREGTKWEFMDVGVEARGRRAAQNVLAIFDSHMLKHIQQCTNVEARRVLGNEEWEVSLCELKAFIALLYVRGAHGDKNFSLYNFWNKEWGVSFFHQTMSRNCCREIMRFLRFDLRSPRSARLQN